MTTRKAIRDGLKTLVEAADPTLNVLMGQAIYDKDAELPVAVVVMDRADFDRNMSGGVLATAVFGIEVSVSGGPDECDIFVDKVIAAIEVGTTAVVTYQVQGVDYVEPVDDNYTACTIDCLVQYRG